MVESCLPLNCFKPSLYAMVVTQGEIVPFLTPEQVMTVRLHINAKGCNRVSSTKTQLELRVAVVVFPVRDAIRNNSPYSFFWCRKNTLCRQILYIHDFVCVVGFVRRFAL